MQEQLEPEVNALCKLLVAFNSDLTHTLVFTRPVYTHKSVRNLLNQMGSFTNLLFIADS